MAKYPTNTFRSSAEKRVDASFGPDYASTRAAPAADMSVSGAANALKKRTSAIDEAGKKRGGVVCKARGGGIERKGKTRGKFV